MEKTINLKDNKEAVSLFGKHDENLRLIEDELDVAVASRGDKLTIKGENQKVNKAVKLFDEILIIIRKGGVMKKSELEYSIEAIKQNDDAPIDKIYLDKIPVSHKRQPISPKTLGQKEYIDAIRKYDIVFSIGPAGTGKTYLAMAMAVMYLLKGECSRIILTRPAVEAGESLGFLPGDFYEKVSPYLRPLYDALYDMMEVDRVKSFMDKGIIEVAPLAYMRGRTLNDAFIILDEAQNCTREQLKMFLTRLGFNSKAVITGDITQSDLPGSKQIGLAESRDILKEIKGIKFISLSGKDIVRHELVQSIIEAYEKFFRKK
jgi:phosphate starvation-inducible PhoH-like protein